MTYCSNCKKVTSDVSVETIWSKIYSLIMVHCETCGYFKHQYLEEIK